MPRVRGDNDQRYALRQSFLGADGAVLSGSTILVPWSLTAAGEVTTTAPLLLSNLAGTGTRMVVADANGLLSTQAIPSGGGSSLWTLSGSDIYYNTGNVAIGAAAAATRLHVVHSSSEILRLEQSGIGNPFVSWYQNSIRQAYIQATSGGNLIIAGEGGGTAALLRAGGAAFTLLSNDTVQLTSIGNSALSFFLGTASTGIRFNTAPGVSNMTAIEAVDATGSTAYEPLRLRGDYVEMMNAAGNTAALDASGNLSVGATTATQRLTLGAVTSSTPVGISFYQTIERASITFQTNIASMDIKCGYLGFGGVYNVWTAGVLQETIDAVGARKWYAQGVAPAFDFVNGSTTCLSIAPINSGVAIMSAATQLTINSPALSFGTSTVVGGARPRCDLSKSANQVTAALGNGAVATVSWDVQDRIDTTYFTHSTTVNNSRITCVQTGRYKIEANVGFEAGNARTTASLLVRVNGTTLERKGAVYGYTRGTAYGRGSSGFSREVDLTAGDYIELLHQIDDTDGTYANTFYSDVSFIQIEMVES